MTRDNTTEQSAAQLRQLAESRLKQVTGTLAAPRAWDVERLAHELQIHKAELEVQNEELRFAQTELLESRNRYRELYDLAPVAHLTLDRQGKIREANRTAAELLGAPPSELQRRPLASFMTERHADILHHHLQKVFDSDAKVGCELLLEAHAHAGRAISVHLDSVSFADVEGHRIECRCVLVDLSALHDVQHGLRASEARGATLLDTTVDAIISSDVSGNIEFFNKAAEQLFGYTEAEALGKNIQMLMPEPYLSRHDSYIRNYVSGGPAGVIGRPAREVAGLRKDGTTVALELAIGEWFDSGQRKFTAVLRDISQRQAADRELRESEARFRLIAELVDDAFLVHERSSQRPSYASPAFEKIWGRPVTELYATGRPWPDWTHPLDTARIQEACAQQLKGDPFDEEYRICRPDGEVRWVRVRTYPVENGDAPILTDVTVVQDITSERELEEELRQAQKMEAVGALASGVAHDFNNVLQGLLGCLNVARGENTAPARAREFLDRAADAARHGGELAARLTAFARKQNVELKPLDLDATVRNAAHLIERLVTEQVSVEIRTDAGAKTILADAVQLEQILLNLAANARDAMPEGGRLSISTSVLSDDDPALARYSLRSPQGCVRLVVQDTGTGMDEVTRRRIFEPFFTTKEVNKGTGIGLSTVFQVTKQLQGFVEVTSEPGRGTAFIFVFPCCAPGAEAPASQRPQATRLSGMALLVEDEPLVRMTVRHYLSELGLRVFDVEGPEQALQFCETQRTAIDLLVSDIVLPTMNGLKLSALLKQRYPQLRVLHMSANPEFLLTTYESVEGAGILRKPFGQQQLAERLAELFGRDTGQPLRRVATHPTRQTVLLVEDEPISREALAELLRDRGYAVLEAATPSEALRAADASNQAIDLVLTDMRLPEMSGDVLAARLRQSHPRSRLIFMSGCLHEPKDGSVFVQKPIDLENLLEVIEQVLAADPVDAGAGG
ncbi:MAG: hypothetical protein RJA70_2315 [Pseudomonadota bacterium]|jgi:PAS domain S-box-containing protein